MPRTTLLLCLFLFTTCCGAQTAPAEPEITVRTLTLNASPEALPSNIQQQIIRSIQGRVYKHAYPEEIAERVRYGLQTHGYFQAKVSDPSIAVVTETPQQEIIDVAFSVNPGDRFRLDTITVTGQKAFTADQLRLQFALADGDIFNTEKIRLGLDALRKLYNAKGYVNCTPVPNTEVDDAAHTISLSVDVDEGAQFRIGGLMLDGEEPHPGAGAKLLAGWKQYEGQIYDPRIPEQFLRDNAASLPPGVSWKDLSTLPDESRHVLNFRLDLPDSVDGNR